MTKNGSRTAELVIAGLLACAAPAASGAVLSVTGATDASTLITQLISGSGFSITNPVLTGFSGELGNQQGTFTGGNDIGSGGLGIDSGVILTTGFAQYAAEVNNATDKTAALGRLGDASVDSLFNGGTRDANVLQFDFTPSMSGVLEFRFVFASEEYNELEGFDDVFGLFVDGVNKATVNGGRVSVNNINCGRALRGASTLPGGPNCGLFINNNFNAPNAPYEFQYDGFTSVLSVMLDLDAGQTYAIKLAIADGPRRTQEGGFEVDDFVDSAVFISGNFRAANGTVPEPASIVLAGIALMVLGATRRRFRAS